MSASEQTIKYFDSFLKEKATAKDDKPGIFTISAADYSKALEENGLSTEIVEKMNDINESLAIAKYNFLAGHAVKAVKDAKANGIDPLSLAPLTCTTTMHRGERAKMTMIPMKMVPAGAPRKKEDGEADVVREMKPKFGVASYTIRKDMGAKRIVEACRTMSEEISAAVAL